MRDIHHLIFLLNKINFKTYLNSNDNEKFEYIRRVLSDNFHDESICRIKNIIHGFDEFVIYFDRTNKKLQEYWC